MTIKRRSSQESDQDETEKAYQIFLKTMNNHPEIEPSLWSGACFSCIVNGYLASDIPYEYFCNELDEVKNFYKKHWEKDE